jgi:uncharacterized Zn finger protein
MFFVIATLAIIKKLTPEAKVKKYKLLLTVLLSMLLLVSGCAKPGEDQVNLNKEFTLSIGQSAVVSGENLSVKFIDVLSDSRCPRGITCVWAGEASSLVEITYNDATYSKTLTVSGSTENTITNFANYDLRFNIQPYPEAGKQIAKKDYRLQLVITKSTPAG